MTEKSMYEEFAPTPRKIMTLFYLVDSSGSMRGDKIGKVNSAMEEAITHDLPALSNANDDAEINVAIMSFSNGCEWKTSGISPAPLGSVSWETLEGSGMTDMGAAFIELDKKLSRNAFMSSTTGAYAPVILLISDGIPTDNWERGLEQLKTNNWFINGIRIAIAIGNDTDNTVLTAFTGNPEAVITVNDKDTLYNLIRAVSVRASEFQSHSKAAGTEDMTAEKISGDLAKKAVADVKDPNSDWFIWN